LQSCWKGKVTDKARGWSIAGQQRCADKQANSPCSNFSTKGKQAAMMEALQGKHCLVARDFALLGGISSALLWRLNVLSAPQAKFSQSSWAVLSAQTLTFHARTSKAFCCSARLCCMLASALSRAPRYNMDIDNFSPLGSTISPP
jgi:hypothetical protein